jgi:hypothetical protein
MPAILDVPVSGVVFTRFSCRSKFKGNVASKSRFEMQEASQQLVGDSLGERYGCAVLGASWATVRCAFRSATSLHSK